MELRHLRYFVAVAREQSVSRAAGILHLSQPALSRQIRDLEVELRSPLFDRSANSIHLNETGQFFLSEARAILEQVDVATEAVKAHARTKTSVLRVGYSKLLTTEILPSLLKLLKLHAPNVRTVLHDKLSGEIISGLAERVFDVGVTVKPRVKIDRILQFEPLREYRVGILVPTGHRLETRKAISPKEIVNEPLVVFSRKNPHYHRFLQDIFRPTNRRPLVNLECDSPAKLLNEITTGRSIAVLFELPKKARKHLIFIPFTKDVPPVVAGIVYRNGAPKQELSEFIRISRMLIPKSN